MAIVALTVGVIVLRPASRTRIDCRPVLESSTGKYKSLAKVDPDGYAYPFAAVKLEQGSRWELEIDDAYAGKSRTTDRSWISRLQQMRFGCTNSEIGTPETAFRIYRNGAVVYETDVVLGEGLQNQELGFIEASNRLTFAWLFRPR